MVRPLPQPQPRASRGIAFVELMVALSIVGVALMVMLQQLTISYRENGDSEERTFAHEKAMAIAAELQAGVERGLIPDSEALDDMDDGGQNNVVLTTLVDENDNALAPDHPLSGNVQRASVWQWGRVIDVTVPPEQENMRYVRVTVSRRDHAGIWRSKALVTVLLNLPPRVFAPVKVYDVYLLALAQAPSLWQPLVALRAMIESAVDDLETVDNGVDFRLHWITRLGYGRDPAYVPFVNTVVAADAAAPYVYWYPGTLAASSPVTQLFVPEFFTGRVRTENGILHDYDATDLEHPHAVADQWNHCMRLPEARALFEQRVTAGLENVDEPPLQILLADMAADPDRFRNAMFVNLHGEGLPMPPLRNYSDAAKDPAGRPGLRVVTHPVRLWTARDPDNDSNHADSDDAEFLVYAYKSDPDAGAAVLEEPITVQIMGVDLSSDVNGASPTLVVRRLVGGVDPTTGLATGIGRDYSTFDSVDGLPPTTEGDPFEMYYEAGFATLPEPHTWIKLYNTPLVTPLVTNRGLATSERLYGMEYIPSPVSDTAFPDGLAAVGGTGTPKNTARWLVRIPKSVFGLGVVGGGLDDQDIMLSVRTRIGADLTTGVAWPTANQPNNLSTTYTWWTRLASAVPPVERYQFLGDPRHNPYVDLCRSGASFPDGYNWNFDNLRDGVVNVASAWPCLDATRLEDGFGNGVIADVPRFAQLLREAAQASRAIFSNPAGATAAGLLLGGEIALPAPAPLDPLDPVSLHGDFAGDVAPVDVDTVTPNVPLAAPGMRGRHVVVGFGASAFWVRDWIGELAPDDAHATWYANGNLPAGSAPGLFHRQVRSTASLADLPSGTSFDYPSGSGLSMAGGVTLMNIGSTTSTFLHLSATPMTTGAITAAAQELSDAVALPQTPTFPAAQPFGLAQVFPGTLPHYAFTGTYPRSYGTLLETHYTGLLGLTSSGVVALESPATTSTAFFNVMGLTPTSGAEHQALAATSVLMGLQAYFRAGEPAVTGRVIQVPRTEMIQPEEGAILLDPNTVSLRWNVSFTRFDGSPYTPAYPGSFTEPEADLRYLILYSADDGETWQHAADDSPADPERRPDDPSLFLMDAGVGSETFVLGVPAAKFSAGNYLFRVVTYHATRLPHRSQHQVRAKITR